MIIYVNATAGRDGNGTKEMPFRHINDAAQIAKPGDEILVAPGIYREYVNPLRGGTEDARIIYRSTEPLGAIISGAEKATHWEHYDKNVWFCRIDSSVFGKYNPYTTYVYGDWYFAGKNKHTGTVYLNDRMMYETSTLEECIHGDISPYSWDPELSIYKWYAEQDEKLNKTVIYANFQDKDPNAEKVEISVRRECFMPSETGRNYITVSGFIIEKAATTWAPPAAFQDGMISTHWSKGWIIEDCEIRNSKCAGISLGKYLDPENEHYFTNKHVKSPTQMERDAVCKLHLVTLHGGKIDNSINISLNGKGGECNLHGLYLAGGKQEISNRVNIYHNAEECKSNQLFKGILDGEAITRFSGTIYVEKGAQKTEAYQANNNLLASDGATAYTKPHLEIYADDVKCSHGATIGSLNEDELFYMRSRGISLDEAKLLQQQAFANATIEDIANPELRERLTSLVESRLRGEFSDCEKCDRHCC